MLSGMEYCFGRGIFAINLTVSRETIETVTDTHLHAQIHTDAPSKAVRPLHY